MKYIGLDFETYSDANLTVVGLENYVEDPSFEVLLASIAEESLSTTRFDCVKKGTGDLQDAIQYYLDEDYTIVAHNAGFERKVLNRLGFNGIEDRVVDSAVMARLLGAGSALAVASRQLTDSHKLEAGYGLIRQFCIPHEGYAGPSQEYNEAHAGDWELFGYYCDVDAEAGLNIVLVGEEILASLGDTHLWERECRYERLTASQNRAGWPVDVEAVTWMNNRAWANSEIAKAQFNQAVEGELNFKSPVQLKKFCLDRGVRVTSLDKYQAPVVLARTVARLEKETNEEKRKQLQEVVTMLEIKLEIGGSMLSKLPVILNNVSRYGRLHDQYVHVGAGQSFRTTGRTVQMQNLARLDKKLRDLTTLSDYSEEWSNTDMAGQLRQVFTSSDPDGVLFVGDFSAVESRGLAYLADEEWKLDVYRAGRDLYKELVVKYDSITYEEVTDVLRPKGKYSELSAGYQASAKAVKEFMFRLGFDISLEEAQEWVTSWRAACPNIVQFWHDLDQLLHFVVASRTESSFKNKRGVEFKVTPFSLPSVAEVHPGSTSLCIRIYQPGNPDAVVTRFIHGVYSEGRGLAYYKATESLGDKGLWSNVNETATQKANQGRGPKQKKVKVLNTIYGGKLAGIATQSLCRELFFEVLERLAKALEHTDNVTILGQFHDEIIVDWVPGGADSSVSREFVQSTMEEVMSQCTLAEFPLATEIKHDYRYIK